MADDLMKIPVQATYRIVDGEAMLIAAEYAEVSADAFARFLLDSFNVPVDGRIHRGGEIVGRGNQ